MIVKKTKTYLLIELEDETNPYVIFNSHELFMMDLYFYHDSNGWFCLLDRNRNVYWNLQDYGYDEFDNLIKTKKLKLLYKNAEEIIDEYFE